MAYNNVFPVGYQPAQMYYPQQMQQPQQVQQVQQPQQNNGIIWVQGEAGAKSYLVAPNTTVQLWDSESQVIYLKSADASGMPSIKILDYTIRDSAPQHQAPISNQVDYATKEDVGVLQSEVNKLREEMHRMNRSAKKEVKKDE